MPRNEPDFSLSQLEQWIMLATISLSPNAYGVSIQDCLRAETGKEYSFGAIYAALERLEDKGFVKSRMGAATAERGGRRKQYFVVTGNGQIALNEALYGWKRLIAVAGMDGAFA